MPQKLDSSIIGQREKFLFYGDSGSGKTYASGTMPGDKYYLVMGGPNEVKTLLSPDFQNKYPNPGEILYDFVESDTDAHGRFTEATAYDRACDMLDEAIESDRKGDIHFDSLILDNATQLREIAMDKAIEVNYAISGGKARTSLKRLKDEGILIPHDNDWGSEMSLMRQLIDWCSNLDKHFCLITHVWEQVKADRETRTTTVLQRRPLFTGKQRQLMPNNFDNVWYFRAVGGKKATMYEALTQGDEITLARTRFGGVIPHVVRDVNVAEIITQFKEAAS